jgi:arylsulfatase A-like enzyme
MLGAYGNKEVRTPNLDRLAQTGTRFLNHFACAPAAKLGVSTLLTGRTPMQIGGAGAISASDVTLEKMFAGAGYACHSASAPAAGDATAAAEKFLDQPPAGKPFFLAAAYPEFEPPYDGIPQKYLDLYAGQRFENYSEEAVALNARAGKEMLANRFANLRKVVASITALDDNVGAILVKLSQKQLVDHTLVIFTSARGSLYGRRGLWDSGDASDPPNMYDEVVNTPMIWSWPGRVPAQGIQTELVSAYDLMPTLCDVADAELPDRNLCGRSYKLLATGKPLPKRQSWRTTVFGHYQNTEMARVERYKLVLRNDGKGPNELHDLAADAGERSNQVDNEQFGSVKSALTGELAQWRQKYSA